MRAASLLLLLLIGCADTAGAGERCVADADCKDALACYRVDGVGSQRCLAPCDPGTEVLCSAEAHGSLGLCAHVTESEGACLVGGAAVPGAACVSSLDCAASGICVIVGAAGRCERACDTLAPDCGAGDVCAALEGRRGYCVDAPDGGA